MFNKSIRSIVAIFLFLGILLPIYIFSQEDERVQEPKRHDSPIKSPFRYVIIFGTSEIERKVNSDPDEANFEVLIDDDAFTEKNLVSLFELIDKRFVKKKSFAVNVFATLKATRTPEEWDRTVLWGPVEGYEKFKYAAFFKNPSGKYFVYNIPGLVSLRRVDLK